MIMNITQQLQLWLLVLCTCELASLKNQAQLFICSGQGRSRVLVEQA